MLMLGPCRVYTNTAHAVSMLSQYHGYATSTPRLFHAYAHVHGMSVLLLLDEALEVGEEGSGGSLRLATA